jgi:ABC-type proline/glycine betaine transport system permease subunit
MAAAFFAINVVAFFYNLISLALLGMWATLMPRRRQLVVDVLVAMSIAVGLYLGLALANPHW